MKKTEQKPEPTLSGQVEYKGEKHAAVDFLLELESLANSLDQAQHGLIGLGYQDLSSWVLSREIMMQVRALYRAAGGGS